MRVANKNVLEHVAARRNGVRCDYLLAYGLGVSLVPKGSGRAPEASASFLSGWAGQPQTISWSSPATNSALVWGRPYPLTATASSGLPVSFRVQEGPAFIADGAVTVTNAGLVTLVAEQAGNGTFLPTTLARVWNQPGVSGERLGQWPGIERGVAVGLLVQGDLA